jgi:hypothetical protein
MREVMLYHAQGLMENYFAPEVLDLDFDRH